NVVTSVPLTPKLHVVGGSFFESIHITADMFILKRILHDWNDDQALLILNQIAATMHQNSTLLIIEGILDQAQQSSTLAAIDLLLLSIFGGKERSLQEFEELANQAGLVIFKVTTVTPLLSIILCHKK
ncbi:methyltransferase, partial [Candidatus Dependentiae bacterium]|nr:methyltransferase [Candidatus Dependentiae bacterium]